MAQDKKLLDTLTKLLGDEDAAEKFASKVEDRQRTINEKGIITRKKRVHVRKVDGTLEDVAAATIHKVQTKKVRVRRQQVDDLELRTYADVAAATLQMLDVK